MFNYTATIQQQFANSPSLLRILSNLNAYVDPQAVLDSFYDQIWNVATAQGYGLDVWGRIVGVGRVLQVASGTYFGFSNSADASQVGWSQTGIWYSGGAATSNYALTDDAYRTLIYAKALANICDGSITAINAILMLLFSESGQAYVTDGQNMTMTYAFNFVLSPVQQSIVFGSGVLPKPTGVSTSITQA